ncbi:DoxX family protein [Paracoccus jeotgali]|uniref:DoxX family protein n=1 Tax=Paracoccus jeotgali TaxID=2065379 RepID=UPI0028AC39BC|nr:DoxX family protein [Paracoccus jeotgali]
MTSFIHRLLQSDWLWHLSRILLTFMYWFAGFGFLFDFAGATATMEMFGLHPPAVIAAITLTVQIVGSALIVFDKWVWLGAGMLATFTLATIPTVHDFWNMTGAEAVQHRLETQEHLSVIGGLIVVSILSHWRKLLRTQMRAMM